MSPLPKTAGSEETANRPAREVAPLLDPVAPPNGMRSVVVGEIRGWDRPGQEAVGYFLGLRDSAKYAGRKLLDMADDDGVVTTYGCPVILEQMLLGAERRDVVLVRYLGEEKTAKGETKHFQVFLGAK